MALPALAAKFLIGEAMDRMGANKDLKGLIGGPKGFMLDKLKGAVDSAVGVTPGTTNFITDPKGAVLDTAKDYAKDYVKEKVGSTFSGRQPEFDFTQVSSNNQYDMPNMEYEGDYKRGGKVKSKPAFKQTKASSTSRRGDGIAQRGKTKGRYV